MNIEAVKIEKREKRIEVLVELAMAIENMAQEHTQNALANIKIAEEKTLRTLRLEEHLRFSLCDRKGEPPWLRNPPNI